MIAAMADTESFATTPEEPRVALVVDDSPVDRRIAGAIIEKTTDLQVKFATDGQEALDIVAAEAPSFVLTDMQMPNINGIELVERMKAEFPTIPVILMTANGSEEAAITALRAGASNFIPKRFLRQELPAVLALALSVARTDRRRYELMSCLSSIDCQFNLGNDPTLVPVLVAHLQEHAERMGVCDKNGRIRLGVALEEALLNGIYHGNLEVSSRLKEDGSDAFHRLAAQRRLQEPYSQRRLHVKVQIDGEQAAFVIRDEGPGFDVSTLPDPTDPENLLLPSGRGLLLIRMFMDEATHNARGNELTIVKRRAG